MSKADEKSAAPATESDSLLKSSPEDNKISPNLYIVIISVSFLQGILGLADLACNFTFKDEFKLSPAQLSIVTSASSAAFIIKPLWGLISDTVSICGYRRKPYFLLMALVQVACYQTMSYTGSFAVFFAMLLTATTALCFLNVIGKAIMVEASANTDTEHAARFQSIFQASLEIGGLVSAYFSGYLISLMGTRAVFRVTSCLPVVTMLVGILYKETKGSDSIDVRATLMKLRACMGTYIIWGSALFCFINAATPDANSASFYFMTELLGFEAEFLGRLQLVSAFLKLLCVWIYQKWVYKVNYRTIIGVTALLAVIVSTPLDLMFATHYNRVLGVPDKWFALTGSAIKSAINEFHFLPLLVLAARICPKGIEGTLYALLMSIFNLGGMVGEASGGLVTHMVGVTTTNYDNYWLLVTICNLFMLLPLAFLKLLPGSDEETEQGHAAIIARIGTKEEERRDEEAAAAKASTLPH